MNDDNLQILEARERQLYAGLTASSVEALAEVMSEELVYVHSTGIVETKRENLIGQSSGLYVHGPIERRDGQTEVYGDLAVTSGLIDMVDLAHGPAKTLHLQQTLVWSREVGNWRLLLRYATQVAL